MQADKKVGAAPFLALAVMCSVAVTAAAWAQPGDAGEDRPTISVTGTSRVAADPDRAVVRFGVTAQAAEAAEAQDRVNRNMQQILQAMRRLDVPERAVRTEELWLTPLYDDARPWPGRPSDEEPREPRILGYRAGNVVSVELEDLARIGDVIDAGVEAGANQLQGVRFRLEDATAARSEAMRRAVQEARAQADAIADAMGMRVSGVVRVQAGGYDVRPPTPFAAARMDVAEMAATPIQQGQVDVSANVTVVYRLVE